MSWLRANYYSCIYKRSRSIPRTRHLSESMWNFSHVYVSREYVCNLYSQEPLPKHTWQTSSLACWMSGSTSLDNLSKRPASPYHMRIIALVDGFMAGWLVHQKLVSLLISASIDPNMRAIWLRDMACFFESFGVSAYLEAAQLAMIGCTAGICIWMRPKSF